MTLLADYRVRARNTAPDSENRIHSDEVAAQYGFKGGLVPGVTVYAYMTVPVVTAWGLDWLEHGSMEVRFLQPVYDGDQVVVRPESLPHGAVEVIAECRDGTVCAEATATVGPAEALPDQAAVLQSFPERPMPAKESRVVATLDDLKAGAVFGTLKQTLDIREVESTLLAKLDEQLPIYRGSQGVAHPALLLGLANQILVENVNLGPWIHVSSDLTNYGVARDGDEIAIRGMVSKSFEHKGHEFVVLELLALSGDRILQRVKHTAIFRPRPVAAPKSA